MLSNLRKFSNSKLAAALVFLIALPFVFMGMNGFGGGNSNNIAKINKTNVTTQEFMDYLNESGISQQVIRNNLNKNIIEELLSGLISTKLIDLEVKNFDLSITEITVLRKIKTNKNFQDENNLFQRTKYEKFLLSNNMSAPMFELQLKNRELQKQLFDFIGAGTITPDFLNQKKFEEQNKTVDIQYLAMENFYKKKDNFTDLDMQEFVEENKDQLKSEYIDFKYAVLNPKNLTGLEEFNEEFFNEIDNIENKISQGNTFETILKNIKVNIIEIKEYTPTSTKKNNEDKIYSRRSINIDLIEDGDNFLLYSITNKYDQGPNLKEDNTKKELMELVYQKSKFDFNKNILEKIQKKEFDNNKFLEMSNNNIKSVSLNSINDDNTFEENSVKMLFSLPINSFTLVNDIANKIYLVKIVNSKNNTFNKNDDNYLKFVSNQNTKNKKSILQSYDLLLNSKYQVELNQKTIDRVKNYFK